MRKLTYTLLGEGFAEYAFMKKYIERVASSRMIRPVSSGLELSKGSKDRLYGELFTFYSNSFIDKNVDLFIAGVDLDESDFSDEMDRFNRELEKLKSGLGRLFNKYKENTVLFVPIQAIDYWILYQKYQTDGSEKPASNSLESHNKSEIKRRLYLNAVPQRRLIESVSLKIAENANFDELARQSKSFKKFHEQIKKFIENF